MARSRVGFMALKLPQRITCWQILPTVCRALKLIVRPLCRLETRLSGLRLSHGQTFSDLVTEVLPTIRSEMAGENVISGRRARLTAGCVCKKCVASVGSLSGQKGDRNRGEENIRRRRWLTATFTLGGEEEDQCEH